MYMAVLSTFSYTMIYLSTGCRGVRTAEATSRLCGWEKHVHAKQGTTGTVADRGLVWTKPVSFARHRLRAPCPCFPFSPSLLPKRSLSAADVCFGLESGLLLSLLSLSALKCWLLRCSLLLGSRRIPHTGRQRTSMHSTSFCHHPSNS